MRSSRRPLVEILYFDGCPNYEAALALVERVDRELGTDADVRMVNVPDQATAERARFLGSPTVRVDGIDVDPHARERTEYALSCRVFATEHGPGGQPDERWIRNALAKAATPSGGAGWVLEVAAIPRSRCGTERTSRLNREQRQLYDWILQRFAQAAPPPRAQLAEKARTLGLEPGDALATLAHEDLVHTDEDGDVSVAYPFSARPRGHRVAIDGGATVEAMCAIDALGIAAMLDKPVEIVSHDPITGNEISLRVRLREDARWNPETAVVLAGSSSCEGPSYCGCCDVLNFFETAETAEQYLRENNAVAGMPVSIPEAIEAGRAIFGDVLEEG
jgi:alkylmercury lyase-like protein